VTEETLSRDELRAYTGRYATFAGVVTVREESGHLSTEFMGKKLRLVPRSDGMFGLRYKLLGLIPISLGELDRVGIGRAKVSGREIVMARVGGEEVLAGERIETVPIPESWLKRVGEYEIVNAGADTVLVSGMRLRDDAGLLVVDYSLPLFSNATMGVALAPLSDGEAVILGLGRGMGETIRVVRGDGGESLRYSGYLLRKKVR